MSSCCRACRAAGLRPARCAGHHCCQPLHRALGHSHSARASLYFYNTMEDVDRFVEVLEETLRFFGSLEKGDDGDEGGDDGDAFVPLF